MAFAGLPSAGPSARDIRRRRPGRREMLRQTFLHIDGVGYRTEERLWRAGVGSWDEFPKRSGRARIGGRLAREIEDELVRSDDALRRGQHRYFASTLPRRETWRTWPEFRKDVAFLDIETTGLSMGRDAVTVVGVYDGRRERSYVRGVNLSALPGALAGKKLLVTFNGIRFDVPFLRKAFHRLNLDQIQLDVMYPLRRLGYTGGLKAVEQQLGLERGDETEGLSGADAVRLWSEYRKGDEGALDLLLEYNMEDVVNLEPLVERAYRELRQVCLEGGFVTADRLPRTRERAP